MKFSAPQNKVEMPPGWVSCPSYDGKELIAGLIVLLLGPALLYVSCGSNMEPRPPASQSTNTEEAASSPAEAAEPDNEIGQVINDEGERKELMVVIDPGHGGLVWGAPGSGGLIEKEITLNIGKRLEEHLILAQLAQPAQAEFSTDHHHDNALRQTPDGETTKLSPALSPIFPIRVFRTRQDDYTLSLSDRILMANRLKADLFLSIHCNSSPSPGPRGFEVYILTPEAYLTPLLPSSPQHTYDITEKIVADLTGQEAHRASADLASVIRQNLGKALPWPDRGMKQAGFQVLRGLTMPAVVVELGFINHLEDGPALSSPAMQKKIVSALADAIWEYLAHRQDQTIDGDNSQ